MKQIKKDEIRRAIWNLMEKRNIATFPRPVYGRIPNFVGAREAAEKIVKLREWVGARVVKANPDSPQRWLRLAALQEGKIVIMATPRMREGFLLLDPARIPRQYYDKAATIRGAFILGEKIGVKELVTRVKTVDMIVTGSVAVDRRGRRLGKGEGYAELEYGVLRSISVVDENTPIVTTIHDVQLVDELPRDPYDITLDYAATPSKLLYFTNREPRPPGILWDMLKCKQLTEIPILRELAKHLGIDAFKYCKRG